MHLVEKKNISGFSFLTFPFLEQYGLSCGFTSREKGFSEPPYRSLNLAYHVGDCRKTVKKNRQLILEKMLNKKTGYLYSAHQVHGDNILYITEDIKHEDGDISIDADAIMTDRKEIPVMVMGADCSLIILADTANRAVCAVHAGWKGTLERIVTKALGDFIQRFEARLDKIMIFIGPCIRQCCYEINGELADSFTGKFGKGEHLLSVKGKQFLDLSGLNRDLAIDYGVPVKNIIDTGVCTKCSGQYYSYRKEKVTGRQAAIAMVL